MLSSGVQPRHYPLNLGQSLPSPAPARDPPLPAADAMFMPLSVSPPPARRRHPDCAKQPRFGRRATTWHVALYPRTRVQALEARLRRLTLLPPDERRAPARAAPERRAARSSL